MSATNDIRAAFLRYFTGHDHKAVESSPLVPLNDPTLMFTNAGMAPFKNVFTGAERRPYSRAVTSQKCVRAGGKHNDLENVGYTARHHTFFEMLGNFSFGDYFKDVAIELAWALVTKEYGLPEDKLLVTVYSEDDQAFDLWKKIAGLPDSKILRIPTSDNFWSMGETGPCGPCSEIFFDHGSDIPGGPPGSPDEDGDRFIEIWNLVFMQFEQRAPGDRIELPRPSIDTGMGLERIAAVLQGKHDNYDIDLMRALIEASADFSGQDPDGPFKTSHRVIADHVRASAFLIADGVLPSKDGRGYVLRRIMRRGMRHIHMLGVREPMMHKLAPELVRQMGGHFGELRRAEALITETLKREEARFRTTLDKGMRMLEAETEGMAANGALPGSITFTLYDTYGFPLDLTQDILRGQGRTVDVAGFDESMRAQKERARAAWAGSGDAATDSLWFDLHERLGATEFLGYDSDAAEGRIVALIRDGEKVESASEDETVSILTNQTPFYGESGGQMGDTGTIATDCAEATVTNTRKALGALLIHQATVARGALSVGDVAALRVDAGRRDRLRANHSATHLLHEALRRHLGEHVTQKGSLVAPERLRFDISHPKPVAPDELRAVEAEVNGRIRVNGDVKTRSMTPDEAVAEGALALFGEKYDDEVRVVSMGGMVEDERTYSTELCGGTHVRRTGDIGAFTIVQEGAVSAGVRRIEALTGAAALDYLGGQQDHLLQAAAALRVAPEEVPARIESLLEDRKRLDRALSEARKKLALGGGAAAGPSADAAKQFGAIAFVGRVLDGVPPKELKGMADSLKDQIGSGVIALVTVMQDKASIVVGVTADLAGQQDAVALVRVGSQALGGKGGGGRPDMAQAGGPDGSKAQAAIDAIAAVLAGGTEAAA